MKNLPFVIWMLLSPFMYRVDAWLDQLIGWAPWTNEHIAFAVVANWALVMIIGLAIFEKR